MKFPEILGVVCLELEAETKYIFCHVTVVKEIRNDLIMELRCIVTI